MADFLADSPSSFSLPDVNPALPDADEHNEVRAQLRILNKLAWGTRGAPGLTVRSIVEDGAATDSPDNRAQIQATLDAVAAAGGGVVLVPPSWPGEFVFIGTLVIPWQVTLAGMGDRSVLRASPEQNGAAIRFQPDRNRGGLENLILIGAGDPTTVGIDLTGAQFLHLDHFQVWSFGIGLQLCDGVSVDPITLLPLFTGSCEVARFEVNGCPIGIRAYANSNQCSIRAGRVKFCRTPAKEGIGLDIRSVEALAIRSMTVEDFDLGVKVRGRVRLSLKDIYYESNLPNTPPADQSPWLDLQPEPHSILRMESSIDNVARSFPIGGSLEDAIVTDTPSNAYFGARRHYAAAPERNLIENGDFRRSVAKENLPPEPWFLNTGNETVAESKDAFTPPRSFEIARTASPNDGIQLFFEVPELPDFVTAMVRYKNLSSQQPFFGLFSGAKGAQFLDERPPEDPPAWRIAAFTVELDHDQPPADLGKLRLILTADQNQNGVDGGAIRVDEVWAVIGRAAAPSRAHSHHLELLPAPLVLATRSTQFPTTFDKIMLAEGVGLAQPPRGAIGAKLALRGFAVPVEPDPNDPIGKPMAFIARPFVEAEGRRYGLPLTHDRVEADHEFVIRSMTILDGAEMFTKDFFVNYRVELLGWLLPS